MNIGRGDEQFDRRLIEMAKSMLSSRIDRIGL